MGSKLSHPIAPPAEVLQLKACPNCYSPVGKRNPIWDRAIAGPLPDWGCNQCDKVEERAYMNERMSKDD